MVKNNFILWFNEISIVDVPKVGGKNASLGEMYQNLAKKRVNVPNGFALTADAYWALLEKSGALNRLKYLLKNLNVKNTRELAKAGKQARQIILNCDFPDGLKKQVEQAYEQLCKQYKTKNVDVAVRSSATAEDLPEASFAGQQETFLNIRGTNDLLSACKRCFASLFTNRAIVYREEHGFDHFKVALSVGVQKMVRSDRACSGVMFTLDTESGFPDVVFITASYGLGESVVQGLVNPDEFYVFKPTLKQGFKPIVDKRLGEKETKIIYATGKNPIKTVVVSKLDRQKFCLSDAEVLMLSEWGVVIEDHYSKKKGTWVPMDIEWAKDGNGELFIVQARPETVQSQKNRNVVETYSLSQSGKVLVSGKSVGNKIAQGKVRVIKSVKDIDKFKKGDVLVTEMTDPDWVPIMKQASAIVTDHGGRTSHAAIVSRELGLPCIVGTNDATKKLKSGQNVTVSCAEGENGLVYAGFLKFKVNKVDISKAKKPKTKVMVNLGNPDQAFETGLLPNDGVGLARQEFIVNEHIKVHPLALTNFDEVRDKKTREKIEELTAGFKDKKQFFVDKLAMGVGLLGAAFYPKPVIVRLSDFKSNEYRNLIGGEFFEPEEENPMLGWRGASRYYSEKYKPAFKLECQAIRKAREEFGLTNIKVMIPMCRTIDEGKKVLATMTQFGLEQHKKELEVYVMCELPSNMILAEEFAKLFDGFSIGSNDLTQMTLGVDRDSALVADVYDERNEAVLRSVEHIIKTAKAHKTKVGICGDAPSTYPEFTKFLIDCGIDSISVSPDVLVKSRLDVVNYEKKRK